MAKKKREEVKLEMTPMIDVVFQLIIFFIVTIKMNEQINPDIILEDAPHGPIIDPADTSTNQRTLVIEVDRRGRITIQNIPISGQMLKNVVTDRYKRHKDAFSVLIRADYEARHKDVRRVMDICSASGIWRINFAAVQEHKYTMGRHQGPPGHVRR